MLKWIRRLFCKHLWQNISQVELREQREYQGRVDNIPHYALFRYYAITQKCVRPECGREQIISKRKLVI